MPQTEKEKVLAVLQKAMQKCKRIRLDGTINMLRINLRTAKLLGIMPFGMTEYPKNPGMRVEWWPAEERYVTVEMTEAAHELLTFVAVPADVICQHAKVDFHTGLPIMEAGASLPLAKYPVPGEPGTEKAAAPTSPKPGPRPATPAGQ